VAVIGLGKNLLFKSVLAHGVYVVINFLLNVIKKIAVISYLTDLLKKARFEVFKTV